MAVDVLQVLNPDTLVVIEEVQHTLCVGERGLPGATGPAGVGVPPGGTTGQVLAKASDDDYDTEWVTVTITPPSEEGPKLDFTVPGNSMYLPVLF